MTAIIAIAMLCACRSLVEPSGSSGPVEVGFYAGRESSIDVKTTLLSDGLKTSWSDSDMLGVWAKTPAGSYALSNQKFVVYGKNVSKAYFTAVLETEMEELDYTYYAVYPRPLSVNGTAATFSLSASQDGRATGADILVATPEVHGALAPLPEPNDHSNLSLGMNHLVHMLNFFVPADEDTVGEPVSKIEITLPFDCAGNVTADFTDPSVRPVVTGAASRTIEATVSSPVAPSSASAPSYLSVAICPPASACVDGDYLTATYYTATKKVTAVARNLSGRSFEPGHATPVKLVPESAVDYFNLKIFVGENYLGETINYFSISNGTSEVYRFTNTDALWSNISLDEEYFGAEGAAVYNAVVSAVQSGSGSVTFDTPHATKTVRLTSANISVNGNTASINLGPVPYLLFEDFSGAKAYEKDGTYTAGGNSDRNNGGALLNGYMPDNGWNASRFVLSAGNCIELNCRYQSGGFVSERHCGRLDTPNISALKSGASVTLRLSFDVGCYIPVGYMILGTLDDTGSNDQAFIKVGTHTKSTDSSIDGVTFSNIGDNCSVFYTSPCFTSDYGAADYDSIFPTTTVTASGCTNSTRFVFWACTNRYTNAAGANCCYFYYIDNIRISINN